MTLQRTVEPLAITVATCRVSGTFPGNVGFGARVLWLQAWMAAPQQMLVYQEEERALM